MLTIKVMIPMMTQKTMPTLKTQFQQFEDNEVKHGKALATWRRSSCFTHYLQLVVKEFEKAPCFKTTINKAYKIVKKKQVLVALIHQKLVANCSTRWDSMLLMISCFVCLREHVTYVLDY